VRGDALGLKGRVHVVDERGGTCSLPEVGCVIKLAEPLAEQATAEEAREAMLSAMREFSVIIQAEPKSA